MGAEARLPPDTAWRSSVTPLAEQVNWSESMLGVEDAWRATRGKGVKVCVLDTLVDGTHPDLRDAFDDVADFAGTRSLHPHGTHVASLIGARANGFGIHGIAPECRLLAYGALGSNGAGDEDSIMPGMTRGYDKGAVIFSMSLGGGAPMPRLAGLMAELAKDARQRGRPFVVCAAAGNDGGALNYPAAHDGVFPVGAFGTDGKITRFTSRSAKLRILGPGVEMLGCAPGGQYVAMTGTSQGTPCVAACVALALAKEAEVGSDTKIQTSADAEDHMVRNAVDALNGSQFHLVNARKAVEAIGARQTPVEQWVKVWGLPWPIGWAVCKPRAA